MAGKRTAVMACVAALMACGVGEAPAGAHAVGGGYSAGELRRDLAAVRAAGGGDVNVVARVDGPGRAVLRARYGTAGTGSTAPVPWDPEFRVASTSKTFTAVVMLQLAAEGRLSLDDTVERWLPGVVHGKGNDGCRITVRDLLQHTSGIYDYINDPGIRDELLHHFNKARYDATPPSQLVAIAMRHAPLGLRHTYIPGENPYLIGPHERVTIDGPGGEPVDLTDESFQHTADSGVVSTPSDLDTFFRALAGGRLLPADQWALMRRTVAYDDLPVPPAGKQGGYGLGLRVVPLTCGGVYSMHEGDGFGVYGRPAVGADGRRAVTVSVTSTTALVNEDRLNKAVQTLTDHVLCDQ
ncbi:serine hydrolase domain-containing protein [Streptomyces sp. CG4]|uniref:serine hydrolase domain-containing protein n=1 Tax=Streptomyces sp. CG4 TaxID=408783 RepID=UPI0034E2D4EB